MPDSNFRQITPKMEEPRFRVLICDSVEKAGIDILTPVAKVDVKTKLTEEQICDIIGDYDAMMVRSGTQVTANIIDCGKKLKIIGRAGVGVDNVDVQRATSRGIFVVNSPFGNTVAAAEHTLGLMLALSRCIATADASMRNGRWDRHLFVGTQLQHKTLGIVGLGQVGGHVARVAREMGMSLLCYDPFVNEQKAASLGCICCTLEELLTQSDYVTLHVPLIEQTKNLINKERLSLMKPTARIVNASRGGIINEGDLCDALNGGRLAGAALDVLEVEEALASDSPLLTATNLLLTPHLGASTFEAQVNVAVDVAQQVKDTLLGKLPMSAVNIPGLRVAELQEIRPLLSCCDALGRMSARVIDGPIETIRVTLEGEYTEHKGEPLLLAVANGVLSTHTAYRVNFVNVRQIAEEHHVNMKVSKECGHKKAAIRVKLENKNGSASISGAATSDGQLLLLSLMGIPVFMLMPDQTQEIPISMFYSKHYDIPGTLSQITSKIGDAKVNIANCHLGRTVENGTTLGVCIFHVDGCVQDSTIEQISNIASVVECKVFLTPGVV